MQKNNSNSTTSIDPGMKLYMESDLECPDMSESEAYFLSVVAYLFEGDTVYWKKIILVTLNGYPIKDIILFITSNHFLIHSKASFRQCLLFLELLETRWRHLYYLLENGLKTHLIPYVSH